MNAPGSIDATLTDLVVRLRSLRERDPARRTVVGIVGPPGAGKSTLAAEVVAASTDAGITSVCVPMDGFHLAQRELERLSMADRKGAPDTFDVPGYVALLVRLRDRATTVWAPEFRREIEEAVAGAVEVSPEVQVVVTEGNYLLADGPWTGVRAQLDEVWFVQVDDEVRRERLVARHVQHGRSPEAARAWALGTDEANARLVTATAHRADLVVAP